jgi:hypothetical protein
LLGLSLAALDRVVLTPTQAELAFDRRAQAIDVK